MGRSFRLLGALDTRIGLRTFLLFGACALVPITLFAAWSYHIVSVELTDAAVVRLGDSSKRYGLLINERLQTLDAQLERRARRGLTKSRPQALDAPEVVSRHLEIVRGPSSSAARITVTVRRNGEVASETGEVPSEILWNSEASGVAEAISCVSTSSGALLHCSSPDAPPAPATADPPERLLQGEWRLFLKPQYGIDEWIITTRQPESVALRSLHAFQATLPFAAGVALSGALLLSLIQIRRSHGPLRVLIDATQRLGRGRFDAPIRLSGRDEYAALARAFNRLSGRLRRQFRLRAAFNQVDRSMLHHSAIEPILGVMLPRILHVLGCSAAAAVLLRSDGEGSRLVSIRRGARRTCATQRIRVNERDLESLAVAGTASEGASARESELFRALRLNGFELAAWHAAPVRVGSQVRGVLLMDFTSRRMRKSAARISSELAGRLAVALSNEDRDRALVRQAYSDALTGLANRQLFRDRLERELVRARSSGAEGAVLFIDLDRFKNINDSLGHSAGDQLLKTAAERLQRLIRDCDTLARLGGDEFTLICPELDARAAGTLADRICRALSVPTDLPGMRCVIQASIGIACFPQDGTSVEAVIRNADTAMYRAKLAGGGMTVFFEENMNLAAVHRLRIEQRLREALEANRLTLHFQPKIDARDRTLAGAEALVRWHDPEDGPQLPTELIQVAEECGLIVPLGTWALELACATLERFLKCGLPIGHVAVNVSARQLRDVDFPRIVQASLERHGLPRGCLELEVTESALMHDVAQVADVLTRVKALGVRVAIDDFGTGYSSLALLQRLPVDVLKIDRAFVSSATEHVDGAALFDTLVRIGRTLGKRTVAEGIETAEQARFAHAHGCDLLQGYFFGRPVPADEFARTWLAASPSHALSTDVA